MLSLFTKLSNRVVLSLFSIFLSFSLINVAQAADIYEFVYNVDSSEPQGPAAGRAKTLDFAYNASLKRLRVEILFEDFFGTLPDGFGITLNRGGDPRGRQGELAFFYLDATNPSNLTVTAYAYNGKGATYDSWLDGSSVQSGNQTPDRLFSSRTSPSKLLNTVYQRAGDGSSIRLGFEVDVADIQTHTPLYPDPDGRAWQGAQFRTVAGVWIQIVSGLTTSYNAQGYLTNWQSAVAGGWYDNNYIFTNFRRSVCPDGNDTDSDNDGTPDCNETCDFDPNKTTPGQCGCGVPDTDSDNDGSADCIETCDNDPNKTQPGICGCGVSDVDTDNDGTADCNETCDLDPNKTSPGQCGCGVADTDSDNDGTANCNETCDLDPNKTSPGICGCGVADTDSDNDGTPNCNETCDNDPNKTSPGVCGCGVSDADNDNDGQPDCNDLCPADPNKSAPGQCGCGVADTDSDNDGTANCNETCDNDPNKTSPGICGCGTADTDSDNDGTPNCNETCDNDPNKTSPGACGCGIADTDSDNDGTPNCNETCDNDPNKTAPGVCGCGVADTDSDNDGTANCNEICDNDPNKTAPGICGCGVADTDTDSDGTADCLETCDNDPNKTEPGECGCGVADTDVNNNGITDCLEQCIGICDSNNPDFDEDSDGVSNCDEITDMTDPCDPSDKRERLQPELCAGANFFLSQTNIASITSQCPETLDVTVTYRDLFGNEKGDVVFWLQPGQRFDVIVNDLGAEADTYGTVCVKVHTEKDGAWTGQLVTYKPRFSSPGVVQTDGTGLPVYDFALRTPFSNPISGIKTTSLNTNVLGDAGKGGEVANWVRLTDANDGDGIGLEGAIFYYDIDGKTVAIDTVKVPDGGRFDFSAHDRLGKGQVGIAEFIPKDLSAEYYMDVSRYFYEVGFTNPELNFFTAFNLPIKPATGLKQFGFVSSVKNELAVVEIVNSLGSQVPTDVGIKNALGSFADNSSFNIRPKASVHRIITGSVLPESELGAADVASAADNSLNAFTLNYLFSDFGELLYAYAPEFTTKRSVSQEVDFNSFLGQTNRLNLSNQGANDIDATVVIDDYLGNPIDTFIVGVKAGETTRISLTQIPLDTYGTIRIDSGGVMGLVVRNDVIRGEEYVIPYPGR